MNGDCSERLSQASECRNEEECGILDAASEAARRVLEEIEALAGTTACKSVQLVRLKKWALEQGCWFSDRTQFGEFIRLGFHPEDNGEYYTNGHHDIFDAVEGNVLMGDDGHIYFIDTIIYPSDTGGYETYRSLSPRCSK